MKSRAAILTALLAIALVLPFSVVALASPVPAPAIAPVPDIPTITATGTSVFAGTGPDIFLTPQTLFIAAQSRSAAADVDAAASEMQSRLLAIKAALQKVGIAAASIRFLGISLQPQYGPPGPGTPSPVEKGQPLPQQILSFTISGNVQADVNDPKLLVPAIQAATANGATSVNSGSGKGGQQPVLQPSADALAQLSADAIQSARVAAEAMATAAGKRLGPIRAIAGQQIYPDCCPQGNGWRMTLSVTFDVAQ